MEKTTEETIKEKSQKLEHVKKYNRDYYHARKKASDCDHCTKTYSSVSALRRHRVRNIKCQLVHERSTIEKFKKLLDERNIIEKLNKLLDKKNVIENAWGTEQASSSIRPEQEEALSLRFSQIIADCVRNKQTTPDI